MGTSGGGAAIKAGRKVTPTRWPRSGETEQQALARYGVEFRTFSDAMEALRDRPLATAQAEFSSLLRNEVAPKLRALGFKGSGLQFQLKNGDCVGELSFQKSKWNTKSVVEFTVNLNAMHVPTKRGWSSRLGFLMADLDDTWWILPAGSLTQPLLDDLIGAIRTYGVVALQVSADEFESTPPKQWPRAFDVDGSASPRWTKAWQLFHTTREDPVLLHSLLDLLETERSSHARGTTATMLAFVVPEQPAPVSDALAASASEDESLYVRIMARYALALLGKSVPS
jgi:hypothetical protein